MLTLDDVQGGQVLRLYHSPYECSPVERVWGERPMGPGFRFLIDEQLEQLVNVKVILVSIVERCKEQRRWLPHNGDSADGLSFFLWICIDVLYPVPNLCCSSTWRFVDNYWEGCSIGTD